MAATTDPAIRGLLAQAELHTRLWNNCMSGIDAQGAWTPLTPAGNTAGFIALHLVDARYYLTGYIGAAIVSPFADRYESVRASSDIPEADRPGIDELRRAWEKVSTILVDRMANLTAQDLDEESETPFPLTGTKGMGLAFLLHHEAYHIGQLGLARRSLGLDAMQYD